MENKILSLDNKPYPAYKSLKQKFLFEQFEFKIDYVQGDPFAAPSKCVIRIQKNEFPASVKQHWSQTRSVPLCDFFGRRLAKLISNLPKKDMGSGKSGLIRIDHGGQQILDRASCQITEQIMQFCFEVGLPAYGRRIAGKHCAYLLCEVLPRLIRDTLNIPIDEEIKLTQHIHCYLNDLALREKINEIGAIAFVADGSVLPRISGDRQEPMPRDFTPFKSPEGLNTKFLLPYEYAGKNEVTGMLLPSGIHIITGGGYHGKSTLLQALAQGVYCNIPGDGRELVITNSHCMQIKAEEGRAISGVDLRPLIQNMPGKRDTSCFNSQDASGSTSQAASIVEAMESGSRLLLMDEDSCATNLLIRDARMQALVQKQWEPITPWIDRIEDFYRQYGLSTILVIGGCGDYLEVANQVLKMEEYQLRNVTVEASRIVNEYKNLRKKEEVYPLVPSKDRYISPETIDASRGKNSFKLDLIGTKILRFGKHEIDLRSLDQLTDSSQLRAAACAIMWIRSKAEKSDDCLKKIFSDLESELKSEGLKVLWNEQDHPGDLAMPRIQEISSLLNRLRPLKVFQ